jgi:tetratricopeptide (TPR) repeat protein
MVGVAESKGYHVVRHLHRDRTETGLPDALNQWGTPEASKEVKVSTTESEASRASERPWVLILEEVEWGRSTLDWVASLLERSEADDHPPVFVLATITQEVLPQRPVEQVQVAQLEERDAVETVELGPLSDEAMRHLVRARIGEDRRVVAEIVDAADGNPGYADRMIRRRLAQMDQHVDQREASGKEVFGTGEGGLEAGWRTGLEGFAREFGDRREEAFRCLEVLAILRRAVPVSVWREACERTGVEWLHLMPRALVTAGLGVEFGDAQRIKFRNPMARDVLESRARDGGRWKAIHAGCAETLEPVELQQSGTKAERMCRHLLEAERLQEALPWLHRRTTECAQAGELEEARRLAGNLREVCEQLGFPLEHPWQLRWLLHRGWLDYFEGHIEAARQASSDLIRRMDDAPAEIAIEAWRLESAVAMQQGRLSRSWTAASRAIECADDLEDPAFEAKVRDRRGRLLQHRGNLAEASREFERALELFRDSQRIDWVGGTHLALASVLTQMEQYRRAIEHLESAREMFADAGMRRQLVRCYLGYGAVARGRERWSEALQWHVRAFRLAREVGASRMSEVRYYLGYSMVGAGAYEEALPHLEDVETDASKQRYTSLETRAQVGRLCCEIGLGRFDEARGTLGDVIDRVEDSVGHQGEFALLFERAGRLCLQLDESDMAEVLVILAASQWQAIGKTDRRSSVLELLRTG